MTCHGNLYSPNIDNKNELDSALASVLNRHALTVHTRFVSAGGYIYSNLQLILQSSTIRLTNVAKESIISFHSTTISLAKTVIMNNNIINSITDITASETLPSTSKYGQSVSCARNTNILIYSPTTTGIYMQDKAVSSIRN